MKNIITMTPIWRLRPKTLFRRLIMLAVLAVAALAPATAECQDLFTLDVKEYSFEMPAVEPMQFTTEYAPGFLTTGQWQQATNGRSFALAPLTLGGGRLDLLNMNWLSWGWGGLVGRELLYDGMENTAFNSMSYGGGAWAQISFGSVGDLRFTFGGALAAVFNPERADSFHGALFFAITNGG